MLTIKNYQGLVVPKRVVLNIDNKDINFKGIRKYDGLLLLENFSLIKCAYLVEDSQQNLYIVKVYNFEDRESMQYFIRSLSAIQAKPKPFFPEISEIVPEKGISQALFIEKFVACISIRTFTEVVANNEELLFQVNLSR